MYKLTVRVVSFNQGDFFRLSFFDGDGWQIMYNDKRWKTEKGAENYAQKKGYNLVK